MNILITGIHGFIGSNLVKELSKTHKVYGIDIIKPKKECVLHTFDWDDLEHNEIPPVDVIIHLAGKAHDTKNFTGAEEYFTVNTGLTARIFKYFMHSGTGKFIFFSSVKAVADQVQGDILTEDVRPAPEGPYGESKLAAEENIRQEFNFRELSKKRVYILRPCMIHGPGNKGNLNLLYGFVKKGIPWPLGSFHNLRSFTSIDNLSYIISNLVNRDIPSGTYNIADDLPLSTNDLITLMSHTMHRRTHIWHLPKSMMTALAMLGTRLHLPLNTDRLNKLTESYVVSNEKIKKALGVEKLPVGSREGLLITLESFNSQYSASNK